MPDYGQITGTDAAGADGAWLIEVDDSGAPVSDFVFIPVEALPDVVPVWSIELPLDDEQGIRFTDDEAANRALIKTLRSMAELKGRHAAS